MSVRRSERYTYPSASIQPMSPRDSQPSAVVLACAPTYRYVCRPTGARMYISPTSPKGKRLLSSSNTFISPMMHRPTEPRRDSHSSPRITVTACASVPAYNSNNFSPPSQLMKDSLSHGGHGAAICQTTRSEDMSYSSRSFSLQMRSIIVGTSNIQSH